MESSGVVARILNIDIAEVAKIGHSSADGMRGTALNSYGDTIVTLPPAPCELETEVNVCDTPTRDKDQGTAAVLR